MKINPLTLELIGMTCILMSAISVIMNKLFNIERALIIFFIGIGFLFSSIYVDKRGYNKRMKNPEHRKEIEKMFNLKWGVKNDIR